MTFVKIMQLNTNRHRYRVYYKLYSPNCTGWFKVADMGNKKKVIMKNAISQNSVFFFYSTNLKHPACKYYILLILSLAHIKLLWLKLCLKRLEKATIVHV